MGRRGSVEVLRSGLYQPKYLHPEQKYVKNANGKLVRNYVYGEPKKRKREALAWLDREYADIDRGVWVSPEETKRREAEAKEREEQERLEAERKNTTVSVYFEMWKAGLLSSSRISRKTRDNYLSTLSHHVLPTLGNIPLSSLSRAQILSWAQTPTESPKARQRAYEALRKMLNDAVEDEYLTGSPITPRVTEKVLDLLGARKNLDEFDSDASEGEKEYPLDVSQISTFISSTNARYRLLVTVLIHSGMRSGEARALRGTDAVIHLDKSVTLTVNKAVKESSSKRFYVGAPKGRASRSLTLTGDVARELIDRLQAMESKDDLIFPRFGTVNDYLPESTLLTNVKRAGLGYYPDARTKTANRRRVATGIGREVTVHNLRHTYSAIARASGISKAQYRYQLGHKAEDMTDYYSGGTQLAEQKDMANKFTAYIERYSGKSAPVSSLDTYKHAKG